MSENVKPAENPAPRSSRCYTADEIDEICERSKRDCRTVGSGEIRALAREVQRHRARLGQLAAVRFGDLEPGAEFCRIESNDRMWRIDDSCEIAKELGRFHAVDENGVIWMIGPDSDVLVRKRFLAV